VLTEQLESCVVTVNTNGLIVGCTSAIESILGYTAAELVNNNVTMLMEPQMEQKHAKAFAAVVAGQTELNTCPRLVLARHKNGNLVKIRIKICETKIEGARLFLAFIQPRAEDMTTDES
jgi:PAS domain S-box-containing protein